MNTKPEIHPSAEWLVHQWRTGHIELNKFFDDYRQWAYEVAQRGFPHFGESADRLRVLRHHLQQHFEQEDEICGQLVEIIGQPTPEVEANRRQVAADHLNLLKRLDSLIDQFAALEPDFESWQDAVEQVELFCDALEQHEEQESDCIEWLIPAKGKL